MGQKMENRAGVHVVQCPVDLHSGMPNRLILLLVCLDANESAQFPLDFAKVRMQS